MLLVAIGMTLVIVTGEIDISVGSIFAICAVAAGVLAKAGHAGVARGRRRMSAGRAVRIDRTARWSRYAGIPSIVVTLATMVALRDGLRWATRGRLGAGPAAGFPVAGADASAGIRSSRRR